MTGVERPILFNGDMVRAILDGRKAQTRRLVKDIPWRRGANPNFSQARAFSNAGEFRIAGSEEMTEGFLCPYGRLGERLWVREPWRTDAELDRMSGRAIGEKCLEAGYRRPWAPLQYEADGQRVNWEPVVGPDLSRSVSPGRYRHARFMPRWACRLVLEVSDVRVERLQSLSDQDARAEGCAGGHGSIPGYSYDATSREHFAHVWRELYGDDSWQANPWVWVIGFKRVEA